MLRLIEQTNKEIKAFEREIKRLCAERYPLTELLQSVPGVGSIVSFSYLLTIDDPKRFEGRAVGAFLGLVPRRKSS